MPTVNTAYSRFTDTQPIVYDGQDVFGPWNMPDLLNRKLAESQVVRIVIDNAMAGRPDLVSDSVYRTTKLDWLVLAYNGVTDVFGWPEAGDVIELPISSIVSAELL